MPEGEGFCLDFVQLSMENRFLTTLSHGKMNPLRLCLMFESLRLGSHVIEPALFLAPMAGVTHSAFRRLLSDFGGYGALYTEMLSGPAFLKEKLEESPYTRRRPCEGDVIYQFRFSGDEPVEAILARMPEVEAIAVDLNLGCPAPEIQQKACGAALWRDFDRLKAVMTRIRACYDGPLTIKCRLGDDPENWREPFKERLRLFEDLGVEALTLHPRFSTEKLKRIARWREFPWVCEQTSIPVIGNGDIRSLGDIQSHLEFFTPLKGLMLGRMVAVKPWLFREFGSEPLPELDHLEIWDRFYRYTLEDFPKERALGRLKEFTTYYAQNFTFGHLLRSAVQSSTDVEMAKARALAFLERRPQLSLNPGFP